MKKLGKSSNEHDVETLAREDWDFSSVPNSELAGCCYWEYARDSAFIRDVRQRCLESRRANAPRDEQLHADIQKVQSIGDASEAFLRGCFLKRGVSYQNKDDTAPNYRHPEAPPTTGNFPDPWQSLSPAERAYRTLLARYGSGLTAAPIERGHGGDAEDIAKSYRSKQNEILSAFHEVQQRNPGKSEVQLLAAGELEPYQEIPPSLFWESGREVTVLRIAWGNYTNDELVQAFRRWVKAHRPKQVPVPSNKGHKPGDLRAHLTRLAVMRLLARFKPSDILNPRGTTLRAVFDSPQFAGVKWHDATKWHDARREAGRFFRRLFPFLPEAEKPRSWDRGLPGK